MTADPPDSAVELPPVDGADAESAGAAGSSASVVDCPAPRTDRADNPNGPATEPMAPVDDSTTTVRPADTDRRGPTGVTTATSQVWPESSRDARTRARLAAEGRIGTPASDTQAAQDPSFVMDYLRTLVDNPARTLADIQTLARQIQDGDIRVGRQPAVTYLRPDWISDAEHQNLSHVVGTLMSSVERLLRVILARSDRYDLLQTPPAIQPLIEIDPRLPGRLLRVARMDGFHHPDGRLQFVEINVDSPAGMGYGDLFERRILESKSLRAFADRGYELLRVNRRERLLRSLREAWADWRAHNRRDDRPEVPRVAIVDWRTAATRSEFLLLAEYFRARGVPTRVLDPADLRMSRPDTGGPPALVDAAGEPIDLVYRRVLVDEVADHPEACAGLVAAAVEGAACIVNPFRSAVASSKLLLEWLTSPDLDSLFTDAQNSVRATHIPWTHRIRRGFVTYAGERIDLIRLLRSQRHKFVIKPILGRSGKGVCIGWDATPARWDEAIRAGIQAADAQQQAIAEGRRPRTDGWIVQEYVPIPANRIPVRDGCAEVLHQCPDGLPFRLQAMKFNLGPFAFNGRYGGAIARVSPHSVINVSLGSGVIPTIAVRRR